MLLFPLWHFPFWFVRKIGISKSFLGNSCDWTPSMSMLGGKIHFIVWSFLLVQQHISHEFKSNFSFINKARLSLTDDSWFSFLRPRDWEILIMEALLHVPANDEKHQTLRISLSDFLSSPACEACTTTDCKPQEPENPEKKWNSYILV